MEILLEKYLTTSDLSNLDTHVAAAKEDFVNFFQLATVGGTEGILRVEDEEGKAWQFGCSDLNSYVLTSGWSNYVKEKQLGVGDFVLLQRYSTDSCRLFIGFRRREAALGQYHDLLSLEQVETPLQLSSSQGHSIKGSDPVFVIYCGDNQDSEERYFISYIFNELRLRSFTPLRYDLTGSIVAGNLEMLYTSRVCIIIFSMNYAHSRECMDEFVEIMGHLYRKNVVKIPVFFKVSFSEVRSQSGSFEEAFTRLGNSVESAQVLKWREALLELPSINKYQYTKGDEVVLAKNIVGDVCLMVKYETNRKREGTRSQLESILALLNFSQSSAPHIVGLWGMAGIGKTTVTGDIIRRQAERFDVCYFQPDFQLMCQIKGLSHLREEFFSKIFGEENVLKDSCDTKLSFTRDRLHDKRVLIVLDGVSNARDAEDFLGGFGWFSGGHTIIFTSRNRQVLVQCNAKELYKIQKLTKDESIRLCCQFDAKQDWRGKMSELVKYASGIPLALRVVALSVKDQYINDEKSHLRTLRQHPPVKIQDAFRISFDGRDDNEKSIFLDLACFFRGEYKKRVVNILDGCGFFTELGIYGLIDESLISLVDDRIEIPNIFQDTGRFFVRQENEEAGKRSRLWDSNDIADVLIKNSGTEAIEGIFLDLSGLRFALNPTVFERMYRLRLLKLHCPTSDNHCKVCLPEGLHSLPDELRLLHWERYPLGSLPRNFNPKNLVELNMPYSNLTKLWKGTKNLEKLKRINLSHSRQLIKFPRLSKAKNLEHIDLEGCTSLVKVNSSFLHHQKLTFLSLKDCSRLRSMPATVHLEALEVLNLSGCSELADLQEFSPNLSELYLAGTAITEMPSSIAGLTRLVTLDLENCNRLQHLPPEISNLKAVVSLSARDLSSFEDVAPPYRRYTWKRVIETVIRSLRKKKQEKSVSVATNLSEVKLGTDSTLISDLSYNTSWGFFGLPERPGQPECAHYMKTGDCKFGNDCKFHHPRDKETHVTDSSLSSLSHPSRPGKPVCALYFHTGICSSGPTCIFDHPSLIPTHRNTSFVAQHLNHRGFTSSTGDSSSELLEAAAKKRRIHNNTSSMDSCETRQLSPLGISSSSIGDSSIELVEALALKPTIHKNASTPESQTPQLSPLRLSSSPGALSSELVEASTLSDITQTTAGVDNNDWDFNGEDFQLWWHPFRNPDP